MDKRRISRTSASGGMRASSSPDDVIPALHVDWKKPIQFVVYLPPPELHVRLTDPGKWEAWQVSLNLLVFVHEGIFSSMAD